MLGSIIRHEWRILRRDRTLPGIALLLLVTIAYGAYNGSAWVRFQQKTLQAAYEEERERYDANRTGIRSANAGLTHPSSFVDPREPSSMGRSLAVRYASLPPAPLAWASIGQSDIYPYYVKVSTAGKETFLNNEEIENPVHLLSGRFDLAFVILYLFPLVILSLSYNLLSSEKEGGTLALTLSQPVSLWRLTMWRLLLRFGFVVALTTGLVFCGVLAAGNSLGQQESVGRLALWMAVVALYAAFWFLLAVLVNGLGLGSATNAMILAGTWLTLVLVIPSVLNVAVKALHPVPSRVEMIDQIRTATREASQSGSVLLGRYFEDHPELAGPDVNKQEFATLSLATQEGIERLMQPFMAKFDSELTRQESLVNRFRFLSPAILAQGALNDIAGTGMHRYRHYLALTNQFHAVWRQWFIPKITQHKSLSESDLDQIPVFTFREEPYSLVLGHVLESLAGLSLLTGILIALSYAIMWRYRVAG